jgi:hypothetical protein
LRASGTHTAGGAEVFIIFIPGGSMSPLYINVTLVDDKCIKYLSLISYWPFFRTFHSVKWQAVGWTTTVLDVYWSVHCRNRWRSKPTRCYSVFYCTCNRLNMFRAPLCPSSGSRDYTTDYHMHRLTTWLLVVCG